MKQTGIAEFGESASFGHKQTWGMEEAAENVHIKNLDALYLSKNRL